MVNERTFVYYKEILMSESISSKGNSTQAEIIRVAAHLFVQQGYHGTSMRQIAKAAGLALGSAYNHFPSKEDIFRAVFYEYHPYVSLIPALQAMSNLPIEQFVHKAIAALGTALEERPLFINLLFIELIEFNGSHLFEMFQKLWPIGGQIYETIARNNANIRPIPPLILMRSLMALILGYYVTELLLVPYGPPQFHENGADYFANIYLRGVLKSGSDEGSKA